MVGITGKHISEDFYYETLEISESNDRVAIAEYKNKHALEEERSDLTKILEQKSLQKPHLFSRHLGSLVY